jgi:hypothetical protein
MRIGSILTVLLFAVWWGCLLWPRALVPAPFPSLPVCQIVGEQIIVTLPGAYLLAEIAQYDDEFLAFLMFDYLRGVSPLNQAEVLLGYRIVANRPKYLVLVHLENNLLTGLALLFRLQAERLISNFQWRFTDWEILKTRRQQSQMFETAYDLPIQRKLESIDPLELVAYMREFIRFKSLTDPRVRKGTGSMPDMPSRAEAHRLAIDIIAVADFFDLPVDFFLGIGAMENNFMHVKGDLGHVIWKRRAGKGDMVLKRYQGRVLVLNESSGIWQITRETLRYAHWLYVRGGRDYSALPAHLRPLKVKELDFEELPFETLTTYAGLLFRNLLDQFDGNVTKAVGAYNGGPRRPNLKYAAGVEAVAKHARKVIEHAAALHDCSISPSIGPSS